MSERKSEGHLKKKKKGNYVREGETETAPFGRKRRMWPHSFFSFIPLVTFAPPFFAHLTPHSLFSRFQAGLKQQCLQCIWNPARGEKVEVKTGQHTRVGYWGQHARGQKWSGSSCWSVISELPDAIFTGNPATHRIFLQLFLFSFTSPCRLAFLQCLNWKRSHYTPPTTAPSSIHSFQSFILFLNWCQGNCISDVTCPK